MYKAHAVMQLCNYYVLVQHDILYKLCLNYIHTYIDCLCNDCSTLVFISIDETCIRLVMIFVVSYILSHMSTSLINRGGTLRAKTSYINSLISLFNLFWNFMFLIIYNSGYVHQTVNVIYTDNITGLIQFSK